MVRRRFPSAIEKFHAAELVQRNAPPVRRRSCRLQSAFAFPAKLIAKHPELTVLIPAQPVRTQQPMPVVINSGHWLPVYNSFAYTPVKILKLSRSAWARIRHHFSD